jgi:hypothetical protein
LPGRLAQGVVKSNRQQAVDAGFRRRKNDAFAQQFCAPFSQHSAKWRFRPFRSVTISLYIIF